MQRIAPLSAIFSGFNHLWLFPVSEQTPRTNYITWKELKNWRNVARSRLRWKIKRAFAEKQVFHLKIHGLMTQPCILTNHTNLNVFIASLIILLFKLYQRFSKIEAFVIRNVNVVIKIVIIDWSSRNSQNTLFYRKTFEKQRTKNITDAKIIFSQNFSPSRSLPKVSIIIRFVFREYKQK